MQSLSLKEFRQSSDAIYEAALAGQTYGLTYYGTYIAYLVSWHRLEGAIASLTDIYSVQIHDEVLPAYQLACRWSHLKDLLKQVDVVRTYRHRRDNALAFVAPECFGIVEPDLALTSEQQAGQTASLTELARKPCCYVRTAFRGSIVSITGYNWVVGYLVPKARIARTRFKHRSAITVTQLSHQAGMLLDLMEAGQGDVQPVTLARMESVYLVPARVWRRLGASHLAGSIKC